MPNWCSNCLVVEGDKEELRRFKEYAEGPVRYHDINGKKETKVLSEEKFIPYPKKFLDLDRLSYEWEKKADAVAQKFGSDNHYKYFNANPKERERFIAENGEKPTDGFNSGGYEWCCNNWGTKWGFCSPYLNSDLEKDDELVYIFETAWSPTTPLTQKMGEMFPKLKFTHTYEEPGVAFKGEFVMEDGQVIVDETYELHSCPGCWNDIEECECTQEDILTEMKENGCEKQEIEDIKKDKYFLAKAKTI